MRGNTSMRSMRVVIKKDEDGGWRTLDDWVVELQHTHQFWPLNASSGPCGLVHAIMNTSSAKNNKDKGCVKGRG